MPLNARDAARFWSKVDRGLGCWAWSGAPSADGYSYFSVGGRSGKQLLAHRVAYELVVGPIPDGMQIDHLCRNRACVNPAHLEAVSQRTNLRRGKGLAGLNSRKTHCIHGHLFDEVNTYRHPVTGRRQCRACSRAHDVRRRRRS